ATRPESNRADYRRTSNRCTMHRSNHDSRRRNGRIVKGARGAAPGGPHINSGWPMMDGTTNGRAMNGRHLHRSPERWTIGRWNHGSPHAPRASRGPRTDLARDLADRMG